ncbi:outer membrane lipoprotein-sorting protein [Paraburkholderia kururiensis]|uniref:outer membrane lipoprotein-sorting protein n=1 Tax=Paraburkholderia kururiensis TaxID=984307 RepID=UPI0005AA16C6|nr:outer membrane lipoprotein-sorting protein [Paraburkholderia kururiensis]
MTFPIRIMRIAALLLAIAATSTAAADPSAQQLLAQSDAVRNPDKPFGLTTTLLEFRNGQQTDAEVLKIYSKADPATSQFRTLVQFVAPARDANKLMLKNGNDLWFYDPSSQASVRISPQQRLLGQAANGDVVTVNWANDYDASLAGEENVADGEHQTRHCYRLHLTARAPDVTYHAIDLWIASDTKRPVKARFFAASGSVLKIAYYRHYQDQLGAARPTETVIIDGLDPGWVTVMRYSDYAWRDIPDAWLQRAYLSRFKAD